MQQINFLICLIWAFREFNFRKEPGKKIPEVSQFSGYSGFAGSPVFRKKFFLVFFKKHDVLKLYFDYAI